MAAFEGLLLCSVLWIFSPAEGKDVTITCVNSDDCVLPCQFQSDGKGVRIMWFTENAMVSCTRHGNTSFVVGRYSPADEYKGRTRLYKDEVLKGNATLVLRNVTLKDQRTYRCRIYAAQNEQESAVVTVIVKAPVPIADCQQVGNKKQLPDSHHDIRVIAIAAIAALVLLTVLLACRWKQCKGKSLSSEIMRTEQRLL